MRALLLFMVASALGLGGVGCAAAEGEDEAAVGVDDLTAQERAAIMDALRATVKPEVAHQDIVFNVNEGGSLRVERGWAWLQGKVQLRSGGEPSTVGTVYEEDASYGLFDGWHIEALLQKQNGRWVTVIHGIGSTDVWWWGIHESYPEAPRSIFPYLDNQTEVVAPAERAAIMDGLRAKVKPELANQDIVFNVREEHGMFNVKSGWCWLQGKIQLRNGGDPSTAGTVFEGEEALFDGWYVEALLKKEGATWTVVQHAIGATDVWYQGIADSYPEAPKEIFPEIAGGTFR